MAGWHHRLDGHESEWTPGVGNGQGGLVCCDSWGRKESDTTERLNWTELKVGLVVCLSFLQGEICAEFLFVCFASDGQGWVRWYSCLLMIGFIFLFYLWFRWGILHRVLLVVGWCWVLYSSGFLCGSSHYLILPGVSSLSLGSWS